MPPFFFYPFALPLLTPSSPFPQYQHMQIITAQCCPGDTASRTCADGHPTSANACPLECGQVYEPFIDECGETLKAAGMGWDGLDDFYLVRPRSVRPGAFLS